MINKLSYAPESADSFKYGDTDSTIVLQLKGDNLNLSTAKNIQVKIGQKNTFLQTQTVTSSTQTAFSVNKIRLKSTDDLFNNLNPADYFIEVWVIDESGNINIYPSTEYPNTLKLTINKNISSQPVTQAVSTLTLSDFEKRFSDLETSSENSIESSQQLQTKVNNAIAVMNQLVADGNSMNLNQNNVNELYSMCKAIFQIDMQRSLNATSNYNYFNDSSFYMYNYTFDGASTEYYPYQSETGSEATLSPIPVDRGCLGHGVQISFNVIASAAGGTFVPVLNGYPQTDLGVSNQTIVSGTNSYSFFVHLPSDTDTSKNVGFGLKLSGFNGTLKISELEININDSFTAAESSYNILSAKFQSVISSMDSSSSTNLFEDGIFSCLTDWLTNRDTMNQLIEENFTSSITKTGDNITETQNLVSKFAASSMVLSPSKIKSANVSAFGTMDYAEIQTEANSLNLNTITVSLLVRASGTTDSNVYCNDDDWTKMENDCAALMQRGYNVLIQPYPYIDNGAYAETAWQPSDISTFFTKYTAIIEKLANYAQSVGAYDIYLATNLILIEPNEDDWITLIQDARSIYSGKLFFRTNWWSTATWSQDTITAYNKRLNYKFWQYVDVIAIAAYFEVTDELNPSSETLQKELSATELYARGQDIIGEVKEFYDTWKKPIFFGELGIPPYSNAASKPYVTQMDSTASYNEAVQANWFDAWYTCFEQYDWWLGYSIFTIADSSSPYDPYGKSAAAIIRMQTFGGETSPKATISETIPTVPNENDVWFESDSKNNIISTKSWNGTAWNSFSPQVLSGTTANRPTNAISGTQYFDTTLGKPIWYSGSLWIDSTGTSV